MAREAEGSGVRYLPQHIAMIHGSGALAAVLVIGFAAPLIFGRTKYIIGWAITRVLGVFLFALTEPVLRANVWFKERWIGA